LVDVARVAQQLTDSGFATRLTISTPREFARDLAELDLGPAAEVIPHDTQSDVIGHVHDADALLLPVNFDADSLRFVRYSMPGKFSAYMASGRPILVYGPPGVPPVDEAIRFNVGLAVTERSQEALAAAIRRLQTDEGLVASLVASAEKRVATHDAVTVKERFRNVLAQAAAEAGP
jgi:glycosyltransferase involved in cell wall biosynthesis